MSSGVVLTEVRIDAVPELPRMVVTSTELPDVRADLVVPSSERHSRRESILRRRGTRFFGALLSLSMATSACSHDTSLLLDETFDGPDGLVTSEYAFPGRNDDTCAAELDSNSPFVMSSGTLFRMGGQGYTGPATEANDNDIICDPSMNPTEDAKTNSWDFRLNTKQNDFANVRVSMDYTVLAHDNQNGENANQSFDGLHLWLGFQDEANLYAVSFFRFDGTVVVKKKLGTDQQGEDVSNGGEYFDLSEPATLPAEFMTIGAQNHIDVDYVSNDDESVTITLTINGQQILQVVDTGVDGKTLTQGGVGLRGDNTRAKFDNFRVLAL